jgi:hypothetical protein
MAEVKKITIVPVGRLADQLLDSEAFDPKELPFAVTSDVCLADVSEQMKHLDLDLWGREYLSKHDIGQIRGWKHALIHSYSEEEYLHGSPQEQSRELLHKIFIGLRIVQPSRTPFQYLHARLKPDGSLDPSAFSRAEMPLTVCSCDNLIPTRRSDAELLKTITPSLLAAYESKCQPVTRAISVLETGYNSRSVDVKLLLWVSGIEALFASSNYNGASIVTLRVKHFLGSKTEVYDSTAFPSFLLMPKLRLKDVLDDIYRMRNRVAHGEWIQKEFLDKPGHRGGAHSYADIVLEATGITLRFALIKLLKDSLLEIFGDKENLDRYFLYDPTTKRMPCSL